MEAFDNGRGTMDTVLENILTQNIKPESGLYSGDFADNFNMAGARDEYDIDDISGMFHTSSLLMTTTFFLCLVALGALAVCFLVKTTIEPFKKIASVIWEAISKIWVTRTQSESSTNEGDSNAIAIGLGDIASEYDIFECKAAAIAMAEYLKKQKQEYKFITMYYPSGGTIISLSREAIFGVDSEASRISVNGYHYGIEYNGIVYCNVHPYGLPRAAWEADFWGVGQAFRTVTPP